MALKDENLSSAWPPEGEASKGLRNLLAQATSDIIRAVRNGQLAIQPLDLEELPVALNDYIDQEGSLKGLVWPIRKGEYWNLSLPAEIKRRVSYSEDTFLQLESELQAPEVEDGDPFQLDKVSYGRLRPGSPLYVREVQWERPRPYDGGAIGPIVRNEYVLVGVGMVPDWARGRLALPQRTDPGLVQPHGIPGV